jgi:hypothetical protein
MSLLRHPVALWLALVLSLASAGCGWGTATPTPTAMPTATARPSPTPTPTPPPSPTATPVPTPTATPPPTPTLVSICAMSDGRKAYDVLQDYAREWDQAFRRATTTPESDLFAQLAQLQRIYYDVQAQDWPACGRAAQGALVTTMDAAVQAVTLLLSGESTERVEGQVAEAQRLMQRFFDELNRLGR